MIHKTYMYHATHEFFMHLFSLLMRVMKLSNWVQSWEKPYGDFRLENDPIYFTRLSVPNSLHLFFLSRPRVNDAPWNWRGIAIDREGNGHDSQTFFALYLFP